MLAKNSSFKIEDDKVIRKKYEKIIFFGIIKVT